ncbi:MAG: class I SAM-dependent methyltransferase [Halioglobus sp.]|nr:class I SAM-dependent methyltransferase [Halioglobus sp.]
MLTELKVPTHLARNHPALRKQGPVRMGKLLIEKATGIAGLDTLADTRVLDIGCGTRFTTSIINTNIPIKSYTGVDVDKSVIDFLKTHVEVNDERFDYAHWDVENALYNKTGEAFNERSVFAIEPSRKFDLMWMFSVITHQYPEGTSALLNILKNYAAPNGRLLFTAFIDSTVDKFVDVIEDQPLMVASYQREYLLELVDAAGWNVEKSVPRDTENHPPLHQDVLLCSLK